VTLTDTILGAISSILSHAAAASEGIGTKAWTELERRYPALAEPSKALVRSSTEVADAALEALLDGALQTEASPAMRQFAADLEDYWEVSPSGVVTKHSGGGLDLIRRAMLTSPEVQGAIAAGAARLFPTRLYAALSETQKAVLLAAAVAGASVQKHGDVWQVTLPREYLKLPLSGGFEVDQGQLQDVSASLAGTIARAGVRARPVSGKLSVSALTDDGGKDAVSAGIAVPVGRSATVEAAARVSPTATKVTVQAKAPLSRVSPVYLVTSAGRTLPSEVEPRGETQVKAAISGPLPTLNARLRQAQQAKAAERASKDRLAVRLVRDGAKKEDGTPYTYAELMALSLRELEGMVGLMGAVDPRDPVAAGPPAAGICWEYLDYLRLYRPSMFNPKHYVIYAAADPKVGDECAFLLRQLIEEDATAAGIAPREHRAAFKKARASLPTPQAAGWYPAR
jgi:hypothetical protein